MSYSFDTRKMQVDAYSALAAVCVYHPWRTGANRMMAGEPFTVNPKKLYRGFFPQAMGAHQLLVLSTTYQGMHEQWGSPFAAVVAGAATTMTITPFDGWSVRSQMGAERMPVTPKFLYRGAVPTAFRQMGLAAGMFLFPNWISEKQRTLSTLAGGMAAAVLTHYPDTVRVIMQKDHTLTLREACRMGMSRLKTKETAVACVMRMQVVAIAFFVMRCGREQFEKQEKEQ